ncbi:782_t:CDS:2 [Ambispora gerdemannii]|uniref:Chromatin modification-related protein EAF6 n=1 Tax=Ambispora gerdemannii TaxID=144530 RepID=A0A9N8VHI5_9GLOM|nr:782_t:CDS:2 [Ambispora gerdemannii]
MPEPTEPKKSTPTLAEYEAAKALLASYEAKGNELSEQLKEDEAEVYYAETIYLEETNHMGNLVKGFDSFLRSSSDRKRKSEVPDSDRLFSRSSIYMQKKLRYASLFLKPAKSEKSDDPMSSSSDEDDSSTVTDSYNSSSPQRKKKEQRKKYIHESDDEELDVNGN